MDSPLPESFQARIERLVRLALERPHDEIPERFRVVCRACNDTGAENCDSGVRDPHQHVVVTVRPCTHCDAGKRVLAAWMQSGPWKGYSGDDALRLMRKPCAHDPLD